jgi:plasmid stability protein
MMRRTDQGMTLTIEVPDDVGTALQAQARANGESAAAFARRLLESALAPGIEAQPRKPLKTGRGLLAKYGPAPSAEEIDANRAEMFRSFG